jgi:hypothetical protein
MFLNDCSPPIFTYYEYMELSDTPFIAISNKDGTHFWSGTTGRCYGIFRPHLPPSIRFTKYFGIPSVLLGAARSKLVIDSSSCFPSLIFLFFLSLFMANDILLGSYVSVLI